MKERYGKVFYVVFLICVTTMVCATSLTLVFLVTNYGVKKVDSTLGRALASVEKKFDNIDDGAVSTGVTFDVKSSEPLDKGVRLELERGSFKLSVIVDDDTWKEIAGHKRITITDDGIHPFNG